MDKLEDGQVILISSAYWIMFIGVIIFAAGGYGLAITHNGACFNKYYYVGLMLFAVSAKIILSRLSKTVRKQLVLSTKLDQRTDDLIFIESMGNIFVVLSYMVFIMHSVSHLAQLSYDTPTVGSNQFPISSLIIYYGILIISCWVMWCGGRLLRFE
ncbi:hypothetical protein C9J21_18200 [Photobacterium phosphoreum]|uniref:hypothetical protein n=1 Tax=Photobacterium phosphoreum TaxID=659 RepID=UPI000D17C9AD|nr:hypothetical protein [Photobacterium phosphoreum]PSW30820.1 hypothetical protein C9J21_18200 [Photobacterium phosphoreum]